LALGLFGGGCYFLRVMAQTFVNGGRLHLNLVGVALAVIALGGFWL
jgi:hypothetical protein